MKNYDNVFNQTFSNFFIQQRKERRLSRKDVAHYLHLNENTFYNYETGTRDVPLSVMKNMCKFYGLDFIETFKLLDEETTKKSK